MTVLRWQVRWLKKFPVRKRTVGGGGGDASKPFPPSSIHSVLSIHVMTLLNIPVMAVFSINIYSFSRGVKRSFFRFQCICYREATTSGVENANKIHIYCQVCACCIPLFIVIAMN